MAEGKDLQIFLLWLAVKSVFLCIINYAWKIWRYNPVSVLKERHGRLHFVEQYKEDIIRPSLKEKLTDIFLTENARRRRLLLWVQMKVKDQPLFNFSSCWQDGIVLCSLLECIYPGICPSYNLLSPDHRVKNCRLGMKLAYKYLYVPMDVLSPEEMAIAGKETETKIVQYIYIIKWASQNMKEKWSSLHTSLVTAKAGRCFTKGSGLENGIVGRRSKFSIIVSDTIGAFNLLVEIRGPNNAYYGERIVSLHQARGFIDKPPLNDSSVGYPHNSQTLKYMEDCVGNTFIRRAIPHEFDANAMVGSFMMDIQSGEEGTFFVTFIPHRAGIHTVTVKWQNFHVEGSPFRVKVYRTSNISIKGLRNAHEKRVMYNSISFETLDDSGTNSNVGSTEEEIMLYTAVTRVNPVIYVRTKPDRKGRNLTVTHRRVLRKILTRNGEDVVVEESISPSLSRQSSFTDPSDQTDDEVILSKGIDTRAKLNIVNESSKEYCLQNERDKDTCIETTDGNILKNMNMSQTGQTISNIKATTQRENKSKPVEDCDDKDTKKHSKYELSKSLKNSIQNVQPKPGVMNEELKMNYVIKGNLQHIEPAAAEKINTFSGNNDKEKRAARRTVSDTLIYQPQQDIVLHMSESSSKYSSSDTDKSGSSHTQESKDKGSKVENESPTLKILHSSSMNKSCVYISQRALTHTFSGASNEPNEDTVTVNRKAKKKAHTTRSLPIVRQTWKMIDDNDNTAYIYSSKKKSLSTSSEENFDEDDMTESDEAFPKHFTMQSDVQQTKPMTNSAEIGGRKDLQIIKDEKERINISGVKNDKSEYFPTSHADENNKNDILKETTDSTTNVSVYNKVTNRDFAQKDEKKTGIENVVSRSSQKGNLQRQDSFLIQKSSSDSTDSERNYPFNVKPMKQPGRETAVFRTISIHSNMGTHMYKTPNVHIIVPKVNMDRTTQVTSDEILIETGWHALLNSTRLVMRTIGIKVPTSFASNANNDSKCTTAETNETLSTNQPYICTSTSSDGIMSNNDRVHTFGDQLLGSNYMVGNLDDATPEIRDERKINDNVSTWIEQNYNSKNQLLLRPVRQSTFETNDSGFIEEFGVGYLRWARNSAPLISTTNGHVKLHRRPYEGQITLDSNLVRNCAIQELDPNNPNPQDGHEERKYDENTIYRLSHGSRHHSASEESGSFSDSELRHRCLPFRRRITNKLSKTTNDTDTTADETVTCKRSALVLKKMLKWNSQTSRGSFDSADVFENDLSFNQPNSEISLQRTLSSMAHPFPDDVTNSTMQADNSTNLDDGYYGFGISNIDRDDLLNELDAFQNIYCGKTNEELDLLAPTKANELFAGNTNFSTIERISTQKKESTSHDRDMATKDIPAVENINWSNSQSIFLPASQNADKSDDINLCDEVFFSTQYEVRLFEDLMQTTDSEWSVMSQMKSEECQEQKSLCRVTGAGIVCGHVGIQNNFQVGICHYNHQNGLPDYNSRIS
ncbi:hypothetical protein CHS0354_034496 [Potamilus streckersoni]|uniref:Calponin-homology (CH) domain-containing protein n=1 Tax=Potamilus streckersoni TaxID=2493646 RepID=A0AAE0W0S0_9BIVA|nr:hypothetical protein CHS0354_034496 [Potamilus streckersoni]